MKKILLLLLSISIATIISTNTASAQSQIYKLTRVEFKVLKGGCDAGSQCDISFIARVKGHTVCSGEKRQDDDNPVWNVNCGGLMIGDFLTVDFHDRDWTGDEDKWVGTCELRVTDSGTWTCTQEGKTELHGKWKAMLTITGKEIASDRIEKAAEDLKERIRARKEAEARKAAKREQEEKADAESARRNREEARRREIERSNEVQQPSTNLYWLRCPVGERWNSRYSLCEGSAKKLSWRKAMKSCPSGYRLPTIHEYADLLGCDDENRRAMGRGVMTSCKSCEESPSCTSMFCTKHGKVSGCDLRNFFSSTSRSRFPDYVWHVDFFSGHFNSQSKSESNKYSRDLYVRCVRGGK